MSFVLISSPPQVHSPSLRSLCSFVDNLPEGLSAKKHKDHIETAGFKAKPRVTLCVLCVLSWTIFRRVYPQKSTRSTKKQPAQAIPHRILCVLCVLSWTIFRRVSSTKLAKPKAWSSRSPKKQPDQPSSTGCPRLRIDAVAASRMRTTLSPACPSVNGLAPA